MSVLIKAVVKTTKNTRECFTTSKNSGTSEGKKSLPEKVSYVPLAPSHSIPAKKNMLDSYVKVVSLQ